MATTGQNITIHDLDKFYVRFIVTDAINAINGSTAEVWWGVAPAVDSSYSDWKMQKSTDDWSPNGAANTVANHSGITIGTNYIDIESNLSNGSVGTQVTGSVSLTPSTFPGEYYHELVYDPLGEQVGSTVIATGTLTVLEAAYTKFNYRK